MHKIKYGIIGASGKMGNEIINLMNEYKNELVFKFDTDGEWMKEKPEILIDFSLPDVFDKSVEYALKFKIPFIIGTTGLSNKQIEKLKKISNEIPIVQSFNFSIGIQLLIESVKLINEKVSDWDIEISETHHRFKKDKPSGTAIMIKNVIGKDVNISSKRLGNVFGSHTIQFANLGEVITINHSATSRRTFAEGVIKAVYFLLKKKKGFFTINDVLFKNSPQSGMP